MISKIALLYDVLKNMPKKAGYKKYLGEQYDNFMETFAEVYRKFIDDKDVQGLADFKKEVGKSKFDKLQLRATTDGFITKADKQAAKTMSSQGELVKGNFQKAILERWNQTKNLFTPGKKEMQAAFKELADEMISKAPRVNQKQPDGSYKEVISMGGKPFEYKKIMPILQERYPKLFSQFDLNNTYHNATYRESIRNKVGLPDNIKKISKFEEQYLRKRFRNDFRQVDLETKGKINLEIDDKFIFDLFRSRPDDFRTGKPIQDVDSFLSFLDDVDYFTPTSKNYYRKNDPDFKGYLEFRNMQKNAPKGTQLSHMLHSTVPDPFKIFRQIDEPPTVKVQKGSAFDSPNIYMSDAMEFGGADPAKLKLLTAEQNVKLQPELETELYNAILDYYKTGKSNIANIEQKMIDNKITTEIIDPIGGSESPLSRIYGFVSETKGPAGMQDGGIASIEEVLEYDNV
jgi:hypothetical protein|tara:strand:+ start:167 stop:1540 length:1374 start_codon:yes stop_codon:yes gene_type:complete